MLLYTISFIVGVIVTLVLYGKVPVIVTLIISTIIGGMIGYVHGIIQKKKAEREYNDWLRRTGFIKLED